MDGDRRWGVRDERTGLVLTGRREPQLVEAGVHGGRAEYSADATDDAILLDRFDDPEEPLYVFADPAGHPFCIFVSPP